MIVIGTAGHIDHGKSSIVRRLTGSDPDRLPEEKARGMTIDLGFAFYNTPDNDAVAFVDVPGHERFVKNMIAGAGGIDAVMLVIAADDGWMPQTQEHFQIVRLLGVRHGLVVINKSDLVEKDWLDLLEAEIAEKTDGSFLSDAPIVRVSASTGAGFDRLQEHLQKLTRDIEARKGIGKARLYIDRSFVRPGIGGVVTGTLRGGSLSVGQTVAVWPSRKTCRVRTLQSQNHDLQTVDPGHRTAVSFTGVEKEDLVRGGCVTDRTDLSYFSDHPVLVVAAELLNEAPVPLDDGRRVVLLLGTTESEAEVRMFDTDALKPGQSGLVFVLPDDPVYGLVGDSCILRLPTPMVTLGGGRLIDHLARFPRRRDLPGLAYLSHRSVGDIQSLVVSELEKLVLAPVRGFLDSADYSAAQIEDGMRTVIKEGAADRFNDHYYLKQTLEAVAEQCRRSLEKHLQRQSHVKGLLVEELHSLLPLGRPTVTVLVDYLLEKKIITRDGEYYNLAGRTASLKGVIKQAHDEILAALEAEPYAPPTLSTFTSKGKVYQQAIKYILDTGEAAKCGADFLFIREVWKEVVTFIADALNTRGELTVAELRERFGFTRKFVIPILEETDRLQFTRRAGDVRVKGERFENAIADL